MILIIYKKYIFYNQTIGFFFNISKFSKHKLKEICFRQEA